ncbi:MAG TPA: cytochrome c-type biogenesis CcmF C-terminal domain-containing protein [Polyangiaceae bacterium]|nr:cytochrome c-type biogenesis CcmF C-terminal domain-containing protein [Polyangiaceae bacterium]
MWFSLSGFGTLIVYAILFLCAATFALSVTAGNGRPHLLRSARLSAYATSALILCGVLLLAYGFLSHDFRIRYISRYSNRDTSEAYLLTALWGGQDGSLLWWTFLLGGYTAGCVRWMTGKYRELQPYVIATLMVVLAFFCCLMIFPANPFELNATGAPADGTGLNPLLKNYWMAIHPPCLYMGFVGCAVPFAFAVAALVTGRLDSEWIVAVRKWMLFAFLFLSIGNVLGMIWAYEELGWGGFWAWDPVENAACLPWFTSAAYVHSTIIQERRNMFKVWNVVLICLTFLLTIFGTFLTRSGMIASVHSFAKSDIGPYFLVFLTFALALSAGLVVWRLPLLRARAQVESLASREAMFVLNNWALLGGMTFVLVATTFPLLSDLLLSQEVTVGPPFYNKWMAPIGLVVFALMGLAPLFGWRKTSSGSLRQAFAFPVGAFVLAAGLHLLLGGRLGYPFVVPSATVEPGWGARIYSWLSQFFPGVTVALVAFNLTVVAQEYFRGTRARQASTKKKGEPEGFALAMLRLVAKSRRRYGGYVVHVGIAGMFLGFVGTAWSIESEVSLNPGQSHDVGGYHVVYRGTRMCPGNSQCSAEENSVRDRRMVFADLSVSRGGRSLGTLSPAKFIYQSPEQVTSEVGLLRGFRDDLYTVLAVADPATKRATFSFHVNPFVSFIWIGLTVLILGCTVSLWPEVGTERVRVQGYVQALASVTAGVLFALYLSLTAAQPFGAAHLFGTSRSALSPEPPSDAVAAPSSASAVSPALEVAR